MPLIHCKNLTKTYGSGESVTHALDDVTCAIDEGEFVAIMGPSGSGKSTLMHMLGLLDRPTSGTRFFEGENVDDFDDEKLAYLRNKKIGFIFQAFNLLPRMDVTENVELPLLYNFYEKRAGTKENLAKVERALASVSMTHRANNNPNQLSGGEKQRAAIARALVNDPHLLFADEPTGNLDSKSGQQVMEILQNLNDNGRTIVLVTHEQQTARHAKRILHMIDGKVVRDENVADRVVAKNGGELKK